MSTYTTPAESAAKVRAALKAKGWTSRQVSVRSDSYSMGSALRIEIKDPAVPLAPVEAAAREEERIHRCEYSGEILSGSNRYVSVGYSDEARKTIAASMLGFLAPVAERLKSLPDGQGLPVDPFPGTILFRGRFGSGFVPCLGGERLSECHTLEDAAYTLAVALQGQCTGCGRPGSRCSC